MATLKPIKRSSFRIYWGKKYYRLKRYADWYFGDKRYAAKKEAALLPYVIYTHRTPLLRQLQNVDMWLQHNKVINLIVTNLLLQLMIKPSPIVLYLWTTITSEFQNSHIIVPK